MEIANVLTFYYGWSRHYYVKFGWNWFESFVYYARICFIIEYRYHENIKWFNILLRATLKALGALPYIVISSWLKLGSIIPT